MPFIQYKSSRIVIIGPRSSDDPKWPRVVRPVLTRSRHTICRLCTKEGKLDEVVITKAKHSA